MKSVVGLAMYGESCESCVVGKVKLVIWPTHKVMLNGNQHIIKNARIGICCRCHARHVASAERTRWSHLTNEPLSGVSPPFRYWEEMHNRYLLNLSSGTCRAIQMGSLLH